MRKKYIKKFAEIEDKIKVLEDKIDALIFANKHQDNIFVEVKSCLLGSIIYPKIFIKFLTNDFEVFEYCETAVGDVNVIVKDNEYIEVWTRFDENERFIAQVYKIDKSGAVVKVDKDLYKKANFKKEE